MSTNANSPIGVFDSGIGGLTVVRALMERHHVTRAGDRLTVSPEGEAFLSFYANSILHLMSDESEDDFSLREKITFAAT
jgi:hypothetical protein